MHSDVDATTIALITGCIALWGAIGALVERWNITGPIAFVVFGVVLAHPPLSLVNLHLHSSTLRGGAELALALVLFGDASRVNARALRSDVGLPVRLLAVGLPLTVAAGGVAAAVVLGAPIWVAATVGAIVAPTDAALGAAIIADERVPARIRRLLNVESGLNDGIVTPFVNLFLAAAVSSEAQHHAGSSHALASLAGGAAIGAAIGIAGGWCLRVAEARGFGARRFAPLAVLAVALCAYASALAAGANGFVSAFLAGLAYGSVSADQGAAISFIEDNGELLSLLVWFAFGASMLVPGLQAATWHDVVFAAAVLTVVRMAPTALALIGAGLDGATVAVIGWFGPRGLASVVFGLIAVDSLAPKDAQTVLAAVTTTVAMSVVAHGVSASPLAARYGRHAETLAGNRPEHADTPHLPARTASGRGAARRRRAAPGQHPGVA